MGDWVVSRRAGSIVRYLMGRHLRRNQRSVIVEVEVCSNFCHVHSLEMVKAACSDEQIDDYEIVYINICFKRPP